MGIRLLVSTLKQFQQRKIAFVTVKPQQAAVNDLLQMASLTEHLNLVDSSAAAAAALAARS